MVRRCVGKLIIGCFLLCFIIMRSRVTVKADESVGLTGNGIELQSAERENKKAIECIAAKWEDIKDISKSVLIEMVGAFLGFLSAIMLANRSNRKQMKELDVSLMNELRKIFNELEERFEDEDPEDYYRYQTPIWEINLESGALALVVNNKVYNKYIKIYSKIQYAQELEAEYVHAKLHENKYEEECFVYRYAETINKARKREAKDIYEYIKNMY